jgi:hypothetical protein
MGCEQRHAFCLQSFTAAVSILGKCGRDVRHKLLVSDGSPRLRFHGSDTLEQTVCSGERLDLAPARPSLLCGFAHEANGDLWQYPLLLCDDDKCAVRACMQLARVHVRLNRRSAWRSLWRCWQRSDGEQREQPFYVEKRVNNLASLCLARCAEKRKVTTAIASWFFTHRQNASARADTRCATFCKNFCSNWTSS